VVILKSQTIKEQRKVLLDEFSITVFIELLRSSKIVLVVGHEDGVVRTYELPSIGSHSSCPKVVTTVYYLGVLKLNFIVSKVHHNVIDFCKKILLFYCS